ncbi:TonB-dependent vitamin B12 receptor [Xanthomonas fragariae]|uniref:Vitamin B transport outer membrane protein n=1 Tax=Xanthomonas fragariae TaxID=48664 RepID=A0A1Y6HPD2_9XANT|nr:TonB-dependent vitamin B12 receptor [Xanthomonas fragariae]AOD15796.1 TonB-dependent vitamin B12 receptor [Xanthomonas fragariae]AOD19211.1 TonB-dependent vitamin B12 receptor [Xanthomonas fragariae]ENZ95664.1 vitamin B transport outer membrane protein [Xanthomonas fragariae LMG 25863]MBL9196894.1 TonB-dependent vitamin B12 receptor [Xanthomonas fragariae]MBL9221209.1 TonB-dependent vitamin B12 receptor [Xanthomonas fragariae]
MSFSSVLPPRAVLAVGLSLCFANRAQAEAAIDLDEVVVTASRTAQTQDQTLAPVTVIDRAQIERRQANALQDLLRGEAGVSLANNGGPGKASSLFLRGTGSDHVVVLIDGVRIGSATSGGAALQDLPIEQMERIEIVRGPFSSLYGSEALGGVIQIFTRRPHGSFVPTFSAAAGSDNARRYSAGVAGRSEGDLSETGGWYSANAVHDQTDGINAYLDTSSSDYDPDRDGYRNDSLSVQGGWRFNRQWDADVHALRARSRNEYDGSAFGGTVSKGVQQAVGGRVRYAPTDAFTLTASVGSSTDLGDAYYEGAYVSTYDTRRKQSALQADINAGPGLLTVGFDWQRDEIASSDTYDADSRSDRAAFAQWQQTFGTQSLQASLRRNDNSQFGGKTTGSLLWGWDFAQHLRLTASYGTAFKAPTFNELYYPDYGNPLLRPETSKSAELGLRGNGDWGTWTLSAFQTRIDDLIAGDASLVDALHPFGQPNNIDQARIRGVEAGYDTELAGWTVRSALTWLQPQADGEVNHGNWLPRRAGQSGRIDADRSFGALGVGASLFGSGKRFDDLINTERLAGYGLLDLRVSYAINADWTILLTANNVFDRHYETARWYAQPGRNYLLTFRYQPAQ